MIANNVPYWSPVVFIRAAYLPATSSVYIWAGAMSNWDRPFQMLAIAADGTTTLSNPGLSIDSYGVTALGNTVLYYGGHSDQYYGTLLIYQVI